ncbi:MAG: glycosyltransferase family 2 protein [Pirellulaceae bacterium]
MTDIPARWLTALPVFNEAHHVDGVLDEVRQYCAEILVVNDGSTDSTAERLAARTDVCVVTHPRNMGYGAGLITAFEYAIEHQFDVLVTIDCDGQHEPQRIPRFAAACQDVDIVSGSRYLKHFDGDSAPPAQRQEINRRLTAELNQRLGLQLTDAFCGFKAYRVAALKKLRLQETGYAMPLELWVQAVALGLRIVELPVPLIYLEEERSFGGMLDDGDTRLRYYYEVLERSIRASGLKVPVAMDPLQGGRVG